MDYRQGKFGLGRLELYWQAWLPQGQPRAAVLLAHGYGEHGGRYNNVVQTLVPEGIGIWALDHRGHGRSQGPLGHVDSFSDYVHDLHHFYTDIVLPQTAGLPLFVLGHSMGSIIAMNYISRHGESARGVVLSGTGSDLPPQKKGLSLLVKLLDKIAPKATIKFPLPPDFISRDPEVVAAYKQDPLVHNRISFRLIADMGRSLATGVRSLQKTDVPVLIQYGSLDESFIGQQQLFDGLKGPDKTLKKYQGLRHEVYNELETDRNKVLADLLQWINWHI